MAFHIKHRYGEMESNPQLSKLSALLDELNYRLEDIEHTSVSLTHESEWCLSAYHSGLVIFENLESDADASRHMLGVPRSKVVEMWTQLSQGKIEVIAEQPWISGYPK